jgi:malonyl CoA-acyl carrier protein transacylase
VAHQLDRAAAVADETGAAELAVLGQSLGEVAALVVAGALDRADAFEMVRLRAELPARLLPARDWTLASLTRVPVAAARAAAEGLELWVVGENGPADVIVVGTGDDFAT